MSQFVSAMSRQSQLIQFLLRVLTGVIYAQQGYLKVFSGDFARTNFGKYGIPMPEIMGPFVSVLELGGGIALILGLFSRYLGVVFAIEMSVAAYVQWLVLNNGFAGARLNMMLILVGLQLAASGPGILALDRNRSQQ